MCGPVSAKLIHMALAATLFAVAYPATAQTFPQRSVWAHTLEKRDYYGFALVAKKRNRRIIPRNVSPTGFTGTWAESKANCKVYISGRLDKMSRAEASNHVILQINSTGITWKYNTASCKFSNASIKRTAIVFDGSCEFKERFAKDQITLEKKRKDTIRLGFAYKFWKFQDKLYRCAKAPALSDQLRHDEVGDERRKDNSAL
jgi:hypothetical protein